MTSPSMVHHAGDKLIIRSVVSGDTLYGDGAEVAPKLEEVDNDMLAADDDLDLPQCKIKRNYTCPHCSYYSQNPRSFLYHLKEVHQHMITIYECPNCLYASKHSQKLQRHVNMIHVMGKVKFRKKRPAKVARKSVVAAATPRREEFPCSLCSFTSRSQVLVARHERVAHLKKKFFRCGKCNYVTHMKARYTKHVKYHSMPMIKCSLCDFRTPYKWNLDRHYKNHMGDGAYRCALCNFTADIKQSLTVHEMNHHVPPVGVVAMAGPSRRRNKVGASDSAPPLTDSIDAEELELLRLEREDSRDSCQRNLNSRITVCLSGVHLTIWHISWKQITMLK